MSSHCHCLTASAAAWARSSYSVLAPAASQPAPLGAPVNEPASRAAQQRARHVPRPHRVSLLRACHCCPLCPSRPGANAHPSVMGSLSAPIPISLAAVFVSFVPEATPFAAISYYLTRCLHKDRETQPRERGRPQQDQDPRGCTRSRRGNRRPQKEQHREQAHGRPTRSSGGNEQPRDPSRGRCWLTWCSPGMPCLAPPGAAPRPGRWPALAAPPLQ